MFWEFWVHLQGPAGTARTDLKTGRQFEGTLAEAIRFAADNIPKMELGNELSVTGVEILPSGRGKKLTYPCDDHGRLTI